jgi:hypothetical protein
MADALGRAWRPPAEEARKHPVSATWSFLFPLGNNRSDIASRLDGLSKRAALHQFLLDAGG